MTFPAYEDIEEPLLCYIFFHGGHEYQVHARDTYRPLADFFGMSPAQRGEALSDGTGRSRWNNMVQWARRKLNDRGYLADSPRGSWRLSESGISAASRLQHKYSKLK